MGEREPEYILPDITSTSAEIEETEVIPASPVPAHIMDNPLSYLWHNIIHGHQVEWAERESAALRYPHFHVVRRVFFPNRENQKIDDAWPLAIFHLTGWIIVCWFLALAAFVAILVCTSIGGLFSIRIPFTTDFLVAHVYPLAEHNVGNVRLGWFYTAAFGWQMAVLSVLLFMPNAFRRYLIGEIAYRIDTYKTITQCVTIPFTFMAVCASVGITNVFLLLSMTVGLCFFWSLWHYILDKQVYSIYKVMSNVKTEYHHNGEIKIAKDQTLRDAHEISITGKWLNTQMGMATRHPLVISKTFSHHLMKGLIGYENANRGVGLNYNWASAMAQWLNPTINLIIPTILFGFLLIVVPMSYYGAALNNSNNTFNWWVHVPFWVLLFTLVVDVLFSCFYWSFLNKRIVAHSIEENTTTLELLVSGYIYTAITWVVWTIVPIFCALVTLGSAKGHGLFY